MILRSLPGRICLLWACFFGDGGTEVQAQTKALLLFGDSDHKTFLGCLNCGSLNAESVCNTLGKYGSDLAPNSIWNDLGQFGSDLSPKSPWNDFSSSAPIIVDIDGGSYGYFSANEFHHDRTRIARAVAVLNYFAKTKHLGKTRTAMCGD